MTRIALTAQAFDAIAATLLFGNTLYESQSSKDGERLIWLEDRWVNELRALRGPGESYSDVILRLARGDGVVTPYSIPRHHYCLKIT